MLVFRTRTACMNDARRSQMHPVTVTCSEHTIVFDKPRYCYNRWKHRGSSEGGGGKESALYDNKYTPPIPAHPDKQRASIGWGGGGGSIPSMKTFDPYRR